MNTQWLPVYQLIRHALRDLREQSELTQIQLATQLEKPQSYVSKIESGERKIDVLDVRNYCRACGTDWLTFLTTLEQKMTELEKQNTIASRSGKNKKI